MIGVCVEQEGDPQQPSLRVEVERPGAVIGPSLAAQVTRVVERVLGLHYDLGGFYRLAAENQRLSSLAARFVGMRPPAFPSVFEAAVNAVACQQLSLEVGICSTGWQAGTDSCSHRVAYLQGSPSPKRWPPPNPRRYGALGSAGPRPGR